MLEKQAVSADQFLKNNKGFGEYLSHLKEMRRHAPEDCRRKGHVTIYIPCADPEQMICGVGYFFLPTDKDNRWMGRISTPGGAYQRGEVAKIGGLTPSEWLQEVRKVKK